MSPPPRVPSPHAHTQPHLQSPCSQAMVAIRVQFSDQRIGFNRAYRAQHQDKLHTWTSWATSRYMHSRSGCCHDHYPYRCIERTHAQPSQRSMQRQALYTRANDCCWDTARTVPQGLADLKSCRLVLRISSRLCCRSASDTCSRWRMKAVWPFASGQLIGVYVSNSANDGLQPDAMGRTQSDSTTHPFSDCHEACKWCRADSKCHR